MKLLFVFFSSKNWFFFRLFLLCSFTYIVSLANFSNFFLYFCQHNWKLIFLLLFFARSCIHFWVAKKSLLLHRFIDPHNRSAKISICCLRMKIIALFSIFLSFCPVYRKLSHARTMRDWISTSTQIISFIPKLISHPKINSSSSSFVVWFYLHTKSILLNCVGRQDVSKNRLWFPLFTVWTDGECVLRW